MKQKLSYVCLAAFVAIMITACGGGKKADISVPKDAAFVMHINAGSLGSKLSWSEIKNSDWFKMMVENDAGKEEMTPLQKSILENPENSGIDLKSDFYISYQVQGNHGYIVAQGKLSDAKKFDSVLTGLSKEIKVKKDGSISYFGKDGKDLMSWTTDKFMLIQTTPAPGQLGRRRYDSDEKAESFNTDSVLKYAKSIYNLKQSASISGDSRFSSLLSEQGDMHLLYNSNALMQGPMQMLELLSNASLLKDNATGMVVNFENGKVSVNSKSWYGKELREFMTKYKPGNFDAEMLKRVPSQNLAAVMAMNYPPEGLKEFLKLLGVDGMLNGAMGNVGLSIDDFVKANKGDILFAVSDFSVKEKEVSIPMSEGKPMTYKTTGPDANILFATSVKDKAAFAKLIDAVRNQMGGEEDAVMGMAKVKYSFNDNWFVLGNNQTTVDGFAGGSNSSVAALTSQISGHPMGGFIDFQKILPNIQPGGDEDMNTTMIARAAQTWENMIFYGGEMKDDAMTGHFEINLKDKSTNSLKQMYTFISNIANENLKREMDFDERPSADMDSAIMIPAPSMDTAAIPIKPRK